MFRQIASSPFFLLTRLLVLPLVFFAVVEVQADELILKDGSRLLGTVVSKEDASLKFSTTFAGEITVSWDQVVELRTEEPMKLMLDDDTVYQAKTIRNSDDAMVVEDAIVEQDSPVPAPRTLAQEEVPLINPEPWRTGEGFKLTGHLNFAFERERGNTDEDEIDVDGDLLWRRRDDRFTMFGEWERDRKDNKKTKDQWNLDNAYNYFLTDKLFAGAYLGFKHDQFARLDLESRIGPLLGYQWFESTKINLSTQAGPIFINKDWENATTEQYLAAGWLINFDYYVIDDVMQFYHRNNGLWSLKETDNYTWDTWTGLRFPLILGLVASTELKTEYDNAAIGDTDKLDTTYSLKLGYAW